jgi:CBS domain-containing protein
MTTINQLLKAKGHHYFSVGPEETVFRAIELMAEHDVGSLLVMDGNALAGIVTERLYARNILLKGRISLQTLVREIMETDVAAAEPDDTVDTCLEIMTQQRVRHLPVINGDRVVGIISIGDLVKSTIDDQRFTIEQLQGYIHGEPLLH